MDEKTTREEIIDKQLDKVEGIKEIEREFSKK